MIGASIGYLGLNRGPMSFTRARNLSWRLFRLTRVMSRPITHRQPATPQLNSMSRAAPKWLALIFDITALEVALSVEPLLASKNRALWVASRRFRWPTLQPDRYWPKG